MAFQQSQGDDDISNDNGFIRWSFYIMRTMALPIIMFNMLIAIMGNTYSEVQETALAQDKMTMAQMILDIENLMVINFDKKKQEYIYICKYEDDTDFTRDEIQI